MGKLDAGKPAQENLDILKTLQQSEWAPELEQIENAKLIERILSMLCNVQSGQAVLEWLAVMDPAVQQSWLKKFSMTDRITLGPKLKKFPKPEVSALNQTLTTLAGAVGMGGLATAAGITAVGTEHVVNIGNQIEALLNGGEVTYDVAFQASEVLERIKIALKENKLAKITSEAVSRNAEGEKGTRITIFGSGKESNVELMTILVIEEKARTRIVVSKTNLERAGENGMEVVDNLFDVASNLARGSQGRRMNLQTMGQNLMDAVSDGAEALADVGIPKKVAGVIEGVAQAALELLNQRVEQIIVQLCDYREKSKQNKECGNCGQARTSPETQCPHCGGPLSQMHELSSHEASFGLSVPFDELKVPANARALALTYVYGKPRLI